MTPRLRRARAALALGAVTLLATACEPAGTSLYDAGHVSPIAQHALTRDGSDQMVLTTGTATLRVDAPAANVGTNTRILLWPPATPMAADELSCATWSAASVPNVQQGLALRVRRDGDRWRAVTVMKNVLYGAVWQFNVLTWDNQASPTMSPRGAVNLEPIFRPGGTVADLPWKVCAKVSGRTVTLKAWRGDEAEPAWGDVSHGGSVTLPAGWDYAGKAGWYLGHIPPGGYGAMTGLRTAALSG